MANTPPLPSYIFNPVPNRVDIKNLQDIIHQVLSNPTSRATSSRSRRTLVTGDPGAGPWFGTGGDSGGPGVTILSRITFVKGVWSGLMRSDSGN